MAGKLSNHWQEGKSLSQCTQHLLDNNFSDVTFRVHYKGDVEREQTVDVTALRLLLLARSPVFFAMFSGNYSHETDRDPIDVHDVDPEAFKHVIRFMYTDHVDLTADNVLSIMYVAEKYIVTKLSKECVKFLEKNLSPGTAPSLLDQSMLYEEKELKEKVLAVVKDKAPAVLASEEFLHMSKEGLQEVLQLDMKISDEVEVFDACMKWAEQKCRQLKKSISGDNLREVLGDNLRLIRFPTMSLETFAEHVTPRDVLSSSEELQVFRYLSLKSQKSKNLSFCTEPRFVPNTTSSLQLAPVPSLPLREQLVMGRRRRAGNIRSPADSSTLWILPGKWQNGRQGADGNRCKYITSISTCKISKPIHLRRIYTYPGFVSDFGKRDSPTVTLTHNEQVLHDTIRRRGSRGRGIRYGTVNDRYDTTRRRGSPGRDIRYGTVDDSDDSYATVDCPNIRLNDGELHVEILLKVPKPTDTSPPDTSLLSDDYITITFPPGGKNLLAGIAYSPAM